MKNEQAKKDALKFLMTQKGGVLSTLAGDQPQSAFVYYDVEEDFSFSILTVIDARKRKNMQAHNKVAFVVSTIKPPRTVEIEGVASQVTDKDIVENVLANYSDIATYQMKHAAPITKLGWERGVAIYEIKPTWLRWSDFSDTKSKKRRDVSVVLINKHR